MMHFYSTMSHVQRTVESTWCRRTSVLSVGRRVGARTSRGQLWLVATTVGCGLCKVQCVPALALWCDVGVCVLVMVSLLMPLRLRVVTVGVVVVGVVGVVGVVMVISLCWSSGRCC